MKCSACETQNRPGAQKCKRCAAPLGPNCYGCGAPIEAGGDLCPECRTERLPAELDPQELFPTATQETTVVSTIPFELKPRFVGRRKIVDRLLASFQQARKGR